jgi:hypothetical protein
MFAFDQRPFDFKLNRRNRSAFSVVRRVRLRKLPACSPVAIDAEKQQQLQIESHQSMSVGHLSSFFSDEYASITATDTTS